MKHRGDEILSSVQPNISTRRKLIEKLTQAMVSKFGSEAFDIIKSVIEKRLSVEIAQIKPEVSILPL